MAPYSKFFNKILYLAQVVPDFPGRLSSSSYLVPPSCPVSVLDLTVRLAGEVLYSDVCERVRKASEAGPLRRVVGYTQAPLVSSDIISDCHSAVLDRRGGQQVRPDTVRLVAWYEIIETLDSRPSHQDKYHPMEFYAPLLP